MKTDCEFSFHVHSQIKPQTSFTQLKIVIDLGCSLKGGETMRIIFKDQSVITDASGNILDTRIVAGKALRYKHKSSTEQIALQTTENAFKISNLLMLVGVTAINLFVSTVVQTFWAFFNMLQILFYIPLIDGIFPENLENFLNRCLSLCKIALPFDMLPSWVPNPRTVLEKFKTKPLNLKFFSRGYESLSFIYNFCEEYITWLMMLLFYILLVITVTIIPNNRYNL